MSNSTDSTNLTNPTNLFLPIAGTTFFRLVLNTARRFAYPFAPALSRGLGVSLPAVTSLIAVNQITALLGALIGPLSDRLGYRKMMIAGMLMLGAGMLAAACVPIYAVVLVALFLAGMGKSVFDPAVQAWAGSRVPYQRRAMVIGIMEIAWSASTLIGIPLMAVLMDGYGWRSPFFVLGTLGCVGAMVLYFIIPKAAETAPSPVSMPQYLGAYAELMANKPAWGALAYVFFVSAANDNLFVVYGAWLENRFGLGILALGLGTSLIGVAELVGEGLTAAVSDRLGLVRALVGGLSLTVVSYLALPFLSGSLPAALTGLAILFLTFEFSMVTSISLCTEMLPGFRATMMASFFAAAGLGRVLGALMGGALWQTGGILATGCTSAGLTLVGLVCLLGGLKGGSEGRRF